MKTKNGIELDLNESDFLFTFYGAVFYFSSNLNLNRFKESLIDFIQMEEIKLFNKYRVKLDLKLYLAIALYKRIEKRGFRVVLQNKLITENSKFIINTI